MAGETIKILGLKELQRSLKNFQKDVKNAPRQINAEAARLVRDTARQIVPRRSGRLARSITPGASGTKSYVKTSLIYGPVIHFGWPRHHISPSPFLYNALDQRHDDIVDLYNKRLEELADKIKGL